MLKLLLGCLMLFCVIFILPLVELNRISVRPGHDITLFCKTVDNLTNNSTNSYHRRVEWFKGNDKIVDVEHGTVATLTLDRHVSFLPHTSSLYFREVQFNDQGEYTCIVNGVKTSESVIKLQVQGSPKITKERFIDEENFVDDNSKRKSISRSCCDDEANLITNFRYSTKNSIHLKRFSWPHLKSSSRGRRAHGVLNFDLDDFKCPTNREEAVIQNRQCLRKCRVDEECKSPKRRCLCDGLCGWSCVRPDTSCGPVLPVKNGTFKVFNDLFGGKVAYACDPGFFMSGSRERTCQGDGKWSGKPPSCREKAMCGPPPDIPHARHGLQGTEFADQTQSNYSCFPGYNFTGISNEAKCLYFNGTAQWYGPDLVCVPRSCGHPGSIPNGQLIGDQYTFLASVTYKCHEGFVLLGSAERYCQSHGEWSGTLPQCVAIECDRPENPLNGKAIYTTTSYQSIVRYECRYGFRLKGFETQICGSSRNWEGSPPECVEIDCGSPGYLANGYFEGRRTTLGSTVHFKCLDGMVFSGPSLSAKCLDNGNWSASLPACLASCTIPDLNNGRINGFPSQATVSHGTKINATCRPQYELYRANVSICNNGSWTRPLKCVPAKCKELPKKPKNGVVLALQTDHGSKAIYKCMDGYKLVGNNVTHCHLGKWTNSEPICEEALCSVFSMESPMKISVLRHGIFNTSSSHGTALKIECTSGYSLEGSDIIECELGVWKPVDPKCVPSCILPSKASGYHIIPDFPSNNTSIAHGEIIEVNCLIGPRAKTSQKIRCINGNWSEPFFPCPSASCTLPILIDGYYVGGLRMNMSIFHGEKVHYRCNEDSLANHRYFQCNNGTFEPQSPRCEKAISSLPSKILRERYGIDSENSHSNITEDRPIMLHERNFTSAIINLDSSEKIDHNSSCQLERFQTTLILMDESIHTQKSLSSNPKYAVYKNPRHTKHHGRKRIRKSEPTSDTSSVSNGDNITSSNVVPNGTEIIFRCIRLINSSALGRRSNRRFTWKMTCDYGNWTELKAHPCDEDDEISLEQLYEKRCIFESHLTVGSNVISFVDGRVPMNMEEFSPGTKLISRCIDIGKFAFHGSQIRECSHGDWSGEVPTCNGLSQQFDYALEKAPTILFRFQSGIIDQSNEGELIVAPGTTLHLECLWLRKFGSPYWTANNGRKYEQGWTQDPARDSNLEYRMTINNASSNDSGTFTCSNPNKHSHSIVIRIELRNRSNHTDIL
ncbi:uncharacterized protein LOC141856926 [Brevipalpus obovatus]|uniref:uncharacterized protein LOC141856926 n=1 Tax=Brevipalpus obovatus TaxID=246614 RepID=UPI003D9E972A